MVEDTTAFLVMIKCMWSIPIFNAILLTTFTLKNESSSENKLINNYMKIGNRKIL